MSRKSKSQGAEFEVEEPDEQAEVELSQEGLVTEDDGEPQDSVDTTEDEEFDLDFGDDEEPFEPEPDEAVEPEDGVEPDQEPSDIPNVPVVAPDSTVTDAPSGNPARAVIDELNEIVRRVAGDDEFGEVLNRGLITDNLNTAINLLRVSA